MLFLAFVDIWASYYQASDVFLTIDRCILQKVPNFDTLNFVKVIKFGIVYLYTLGMTWNP